MKTLSIETPSHGRVLVVEPEDGRAPALTLVGFHGYGQGADEMMAELQKIPGSAAWTLIAIQGLNRFYTRGDQNIVASWMTRQDREDAIADNIEYVDRALEEAYVGPNSSSGVCFLGFSQGAAMAYRAALLGRHLVARIVAIGGDVPPDIKDVPAERWPKVLIAAGDTDPWFTAAKAEADSAFLTTHGVAHEVSRYDGKHEITTQLRLNLANWLTE